MELCQYYQSHNEVDIVEMLIRQVAELLNNYPTCI